MSGIGSGLNRSFTSPKSKLGERISASAQETISVKNTRNAIANGSSAVGVALAGMSVVVPPSAVSTVTKIVEDGLSPTLIGDMLLKLPGNKVFTIKEGDTLNDIARSTLGEKATTEQVNKFIDKIVDLNSDIIQNKNKIYIGDKIAIPEQNYKEGRAKSNIFLIDN